MKNFKNYLILLIFTFSFANAREVKRWVTVGKGTFEQGFIYPYKISLSLPYGERDIGDIKQGLIPAKFKLKWIVPEFSKDEVEKLFSKQLENNYKSNENYVLSYNLIQYFLKKLPEVKKNDKWEFIYYPDAGAKLYINNKQLHHLVGAELNRALLDSWLNESPVLASHLLTRLLKLKKRLKK